MPSGQVARSLRSGRDDITQYRFENAFKPIQKERNSEFPFHNLTAELPQLGAPLRIADKPLHCSH